MVQILQDLPDKVKKYPMMLHNTTETSITREWSLEVKMFLQAFLAPQVVLWVHVLLVCPGMEYEEICISNRHMYIIYLTISRRFLTQRYNLILIQAVGMSHATHSISWAAWCSNWARGGTSITLCGAMILTQCLWVTKSVI